MPSEAAALPLEELEGAMCSELAFSAFLGGSPCTPQVSGVSVSSAALPGHCTMGMLLREGAGMEMEFCHFADANLH